MCVANARRFSLDRTLGGCVSILAGVAACGVSGSVVGYQLADRCPGADATAPAAGARGCCAGVRVRGV